MPVDARSIAVPSGLSSEECDPAEDHAARQRGAEAVAVVVGQDHHQQGRGEDEQQGAGDHAERPVVQHAAMLADYLTRLMIWNIGMYSATTMPPTAPPMTTISSGSSSDVRASTVASISWS